jgi:hypothetical protein
MTMLLVGIAGSKRSGKTLLANLLAERYGLLHTSFAAPIREFTANLLGGTLEQLEVEKESPIAWLDGKTPRFIMQTMGTDWARQMVCHDIWVRVCMRKVSGAGRAVISDVRFPNEAKAIRDAGGHVIRLHRWDGAKYDGHISELPLNDSLIDCELTNDFDNPTELLNAAEAALRHAFTGSRALSA